MESITVTSANPSDETWLTTWLARQSHFYAKFGPSELGEWLKDENGLIAWVENRPVGLLIYFPTWGEYASIVALALESEREKEHIVGALLAACYSSLMRRGLFVLTCITTLAWVVWTLRTHGFYIVNQLTSYMKSDFALPQLKPCSAIIRKAMSTDLPAIAEVDALAFEPLWRQSTDLLRYTLQRGYLILAEKAGGVVGYASGTWSGEHGHISRLAVVPGHQRRGIGSHLLAASVKQLQLSGAAYVTLNTQSDNLASRRLYEHFGFRIINSSTLVLLKRL